MRIVLTTLPTTLSAGRMGRKLVEGRFAACVSTLPIESTYWWKGKVEGARESLVICKTADARVGALVREIRRLHPYETPEIVVLKPSRVNAEYRTWIEGSLSVPALRGSRRDRADRALR